MIGRAGLSGRVRGLVASAAAAGLLLIVVGTFLPWLRSGSRLRNSYEADGAIRRLLEPQGPLHAVLAAWPAIGLVCAVVVAVYALGARTAALVLALLVALSAGAIAVAALSAPRVHAATVTPHGPVLTLIGAVLVVGGVIIRFASFVRDDRRYR